MSALRIKTGALVYGLLSAAALAWAFGRNEPNLFVHPEGFLTARVPLFAATLVGLVAGLLFGLFVAYLTRVSVYRFEWARGLHMEFRGLLGQMTGTEIWAYASMAALGEEMLFRGAMQPVLGIVPTSLIFGLAHIAWGRKSIPWPVQAIVMGFAFGGLFWLTGNLVAPIVAHFVINYQNLHFINSYDPSLQMPKVLRSSQHSDL